MDDSLLRKQVLHVGKKPIVLGDEGGETKGGGAKERQEFTRGPIAKHNVGVMGTNLRKQARKRDKTASSKSNSMT